MCIYLYAYSNNLYDCTAVKYVKYMTVVPGCRPSGTTLSGCSRKSWLKPLASLAPERVESERCALAALKPEFLQGVLGEALPEAVFKNLMTTFYSKVILPVSLIWGTAEAQRLSQGLLLETHTGHLSLWLCASTSSLLDTEGGSCCACNFCVLSIQPRKGSEAIGIQNHRLLEITQSRLLPVRAQNKSGWSEMQAPAPLFLAASELLR